MNTEQTNTGGSYVNGRIKESVYSRSVFTFSKSRDVLLGVLREVWNHHGDGQQLRWFAYALGLLATATAIRMLYSTMIRDTPVEFNRALLGLSIPFIFCFRNKPFRNVCLTLAIIAVLLSKQWIGIICLAILYAVILFNKNKVLGTVFISLCICLSMASNTLMKAQTPIKDFSDRFAIYEFTLSKWKNISWGQGVGSFSKLPENQPKVRKDKKLLNHPHSELIMSLFELGIFITLGLVILLLLPLLWSKVDLLHVSYLCLIFQSLIDFPLHRNTTFLVSVIIIVLMYCRNLYSKEDFDIFRI
jgi:hypothetical protein